jgi:prevent-host-death family protein
MSEQLPHIAAGQFKAKCLGLMDLVNQQKKEIIITKHGQPIAKLVPFTQDFPTLHGFCKGSIKIQGDIIKSPPQQWNADA